VTTGSIGKALLSSADDGAEAHYRAGTLNAFTAVVMIDACYWLHADTHISTNTKNAI